MQRPNTNSASMISNPKSNANWIMAHRVAELRVHTFNPSRKARGHGHLGAGTAGGELEAAAGRAAKKEQHGKRRKKKNAAEESGRRGGDRFGRIGLAAAASTGPSAQ